jgi:hypothetical protein
MKIKYYLLPALQIWTWNFVSNLSAQTGAPLMRDFIGIHVKAQLPSQKMSKVGFGRNFHLWADDQGNPLGGRGDRLPFR